MKRELSGNLIINSAITFYQSGDILLGIREMKVIQKNVPRVVFDYGKNIQQQIGVSTLLLRF